MSQPKRPVQMEESWFNLLSDVFDMPFMQDLSTFLRREQASKQRVFPPAKQMFAAFDATPVDQVRCVILGQDPYHGPNQAHGLSFSVPPGVPVPPSLRNIYKEIQQDVGITMPNHGHLLPWANQGVLLLNSILSVRAGQAGSHRNKGWEQFTDLVIERLAAQKEHLVFMLWGSYAQTKGKGISRDTHCVLRAPHPSPLSAHRGFFGCQHFSKANRYLAHHGLGEIDWHLPE